MKFFGIFFCAIFWYKNSLSVQIAWSQVLKWLRFCKKKTKHNPPQNPNKITLFHRNRLRSSGSYGDPPPFTIKISKMGLCSDLSWPKLGPKPKFHDAGTFGGFRKRAQSLSNIQRVFDTGPYGDPLENENFGNLTSPCFKLA